METNYIEYNFESSLSRIDEILNADSKSYQEVGSIPCRSKLTHTNGFYVNCTAVFVDFVVAVSSPKYIIVLSLQRFIVVSFLRWSLFSMGTRTVEKSMCKETVFGLCLIPLNQTILAVC